MTDQLRRAAETMREVRDKCVWTQQIDHRALVPYLVEESHEVIDAVETDDRRALREELGDLLWQVLFHAEIASRDDGDPFDIDDVAGDLADKMVRRHPHVFAGETATTPEEVRVHWNAAKAAEKHTRTSVLDGVPFSMPALALAQKVLGRAASIGLAPQTAAAAPSSGLPSSRSTSPRVLPSPRPSPRVHDTRSHGTPNPRVVDTQPGGTGPGGTDQGVGSEGELGRELMALVELARKRGWDAERALREQVRALASEVRGVEAGTTAPDLEE